MLKPKLKPCKSCSKLKMIWKDGKCQQCCSSSFKSFKKTSSSFKSSRSSLKKGKPKSKGNKEFFKTIADYHQENPVSFESGKNLGNLGTVNMAHIFPKERYKSIAHEPLNIILLSWEEHTRFDELLGRHDFEKLESEFKSWRKICQRVLILLPLCIENGKLKHKLEKYVNFR